MDMTLPKYLRRKPAASYLNDTWGLPTAASTLAKLAVVGGGPSFHSAGRIPLYEIPELDRYAQKKLGKPRRSTSDLANEPPANVGVDSVNRGADAIEDLRDGQIRDQ
jgi:hypothetical protein